MYIVYICVQCTGRSDTYIYIVVYVHTQCCIMRGSRTFLQGGGGGEVRRLFELRGGGGDGGLKDFSGNFIM